MLTTLRAWLPLEDKLSSVSCDASITTWARIANAETSSGRRNDDDRQANASPTTHAHSLSGCPRWRWHLRFRRTGQGTGANQSYASLRSYAQQGHIIACFLADSGKVVRRERGRSGGWCAGVRRPRPVKWCTNCRLLHPLVHRFSSP